jgi:hypothetical protein
MKLEGPSVEGLNKHWHSNEETEENHDEPQNTSYSTEIRTTYQTVSLQLRHATRKHKNNSKLCR